MPCRITYCKGAQNWSGSLDTCVCVDCERYKTVPQIDKLIFTDIFARQSKTLRATNVLNGHMLETPRKI